MGVIVPMPTTTQVVDQTFFIEAIGGPQHPVTYLDRFPDSVYTKAIDSRLVRLMYTLLGPAGVGGLRNEYMQARLAIETQTLTTQQLNQLYGGAGFERVLEETYLHDPSGLLPQQAWNEVTTKDAMYRNRAIDFLNGVRMGGTLNGLRLVARAGLGHDVEIIENYRALFDQHSDDPLGLDYLGQTTSTEEMIILPRREVSKSAMQQIAMTGAPNNGTFRLFFPMGDEVANTTPPLNWNIDRFALQDALEALPAVGRGNVELMGGPLPGESIFVQFTGQLAARPLPNFIASWDNLGSASSMVVVTAEATGVEATDEVVAIPPQDLWYLQAAVDRIKPMTTIPTVSMAAGQTTRQLWNTIVASSELITVLRYVRGRQGIAWPALDPVHWIEPGVEHEAPKPQGTASQHYQGFHNISNVTASSTHIGPFYPYQVALFPYLDAAVDQSFPAKLALAPYTEPLTVTSTANNVVLINQAYPADYQALTSVAQPAHLIGGFWASTERLDASETLTIDLGTAQAVNYVYFEISRKPVDISMSVDVLDQAPNQSWMAVTPINGLPSATSIRFDSSNANRWAIVEQNFTNRLRQMIFTRYLQITFTRRGDQGSPFIATDGHTPLPWSIEVRNLRVGRNIA